ncbi:protein ADM2 [Engraulis encrasicolus]|uniref:protein ADM2 n=1 Tax=Engraulis encrasicolus TaxID=184585 RepID=UPI002FD52146
MLAFLHVCVCCYLILNIVTLPVTGAPRPRNRLDFPTKSEEEDGGAMVAMGTVVRPAVAPSDRWRERQPGVWRVLLKKAPPLGRPGEVPVQNATAGEVLIESTKRSGGGLWSRSRGRRHTILRSRGGHHHHGHMMRVGCVLGTCQVQNLSHRLYQLIGQTGREDSSPIHPRSPHSYG